MARNKTDGANASSKLTFQPDHSVGAGQGKLCAKVGITGLTFHDLRGTAVTKLARAGATVQEIASITGHSMKDVSTILDRHYLGDRAGLAASGIKKLERKEKRTKTVNQL